MKCKNKHFFVDGVIFKQKTNDMLKAKLEVIVTNDELGKTISVNDGNNLQFTFAADDIAKYLN